MGILKSSKEKLLPSKILAIQFKYFGDAVFMTPAIKALKDSAPNVELHVLVAAEIAPLLENIPWITKVWAMPRERGKAQLSKSIPFVRALRKIHFDRSVDLGGNDRGAWLSLLCGAKIRLGANDGKPKFLQSLAYTQYLQYDGQEKSYVDLHFVLLKVWGIDKPANLRLEIGCDVQFTNVAQLLLPNNDYVICHVTTSQPKKDWPIAHWVALYQLCNKTGISLVFTAGTNARETDILNAFKLAVPQAHCLAPILQLPVFLNVLKRAKVVIAGDTGPLHFAAGLQISTLGLFAVNSTLSQAAPIYNDANKLMVDACTCYANFSQLDYCKEKLPCISAITPQAVFDKLIILLAQNDGFAAKNADC